jgi:two-component sensor histidine kinase
VCWFDERTYPADSSTPLLARRFTADRVRQVLRVDPAARALVDDAGLMVSELVTNAVNASATTITVRLDIHRDHARIAVTDDAPGSPMLRIPSPNATGGRGLRIVDQLARRWGTGPTSDGKQTWAELSVDPAVTATLNCTI